MTLAKPLYWITNKYSNRIAHRKLNTFEERNPALELRAGNINHATWAKAHACVLAQRRLDVKDLKRKLKAAERMLAQAQAMKHPDPKP